MFRSLDWSADGPTPVFGEHNPALLLVNGRETKDGSRKVKKPKNNLVKTNSSFVTRAQLADGLNKRLADPAPGRIFAFANIGRSFHWLDLSAPEKSMKVCLCSKFARAKLKR
jgi:hypothetical protein